MSEEAKELERVVVARASWAAVTGEEPGKGRGKSKDKKGKEPGKGRGQVSSGVRSEGKGRGQVSAGWNLYLSDGKEVGKGKGKSKDKKGKEPGKGKEHGKGKDKSEGGGETNPYGGGWNLFLSDGKGKDPGKGEKTRSWSPHDDLVLGYDTLFLAAKGKGKDNGKDKGKGKSKDQDEDLIVVAPDIAAFERGGGVAGLQLRLPLELLIFIHNGPLVSNDC